MRVSRHPLLSSKDLQGSANTVKNIRLLVLFTQVHDLPQCRKIRLCNMRHGSAAQRRSNAEPFPRMQAADNRPACGVCRKSPSVLVEPINLTACAFPAGYFDKLAVRQEFGEFHCRPHGFMAHGFISFPSSSVARRKVQGLVAAGASACALA
jgi:hypothetical protein